MLLQQDADGHDPIASVEFCKCRSDIPDGCDTNGFRQAFGRYAQTDRQFPIWVNSQLRAVEGGRRQDIRNHRESPHLSGELGRHVRDRGIVLAGDDEGYVTLSIVVEEPVANIRYVREILADRVLELMLRQ